MSPLICHFIQCEENTSVHQMSLFINNNNIAGPGVRPQKLFLADTGKYYIIIK